MTIEDFEPGKPNRLTAVLRRVSGQAAAVRAGAARLAQRVPGTIRATRTSATRLVGHLPATVKATQSGVRATTGALQQLPDSTLRSVAASAAGLGAGLYLAGKTRLAVVTGIVPALIVSVAIAVRPVKPVAPGKSNP